MQAPYLIAICGNSGSGKTYISRMITERINGIIQSARIDSLKNVIATFTQDNYYKPLDEQPLDENGKPNFDLPQSLNLAQFMSDLKLLKSGIPITQRTYKYNKRVTPNTLKPGSDILTIEPATVIIAEGIFVYHTDELFKMYDLTIFVDTDIDTQLSRRINRDREERGYSQSEVFYQFENHIKPAIADYLVPQKLRSDLIIQNFNDPSRAVGVIANHIIGVIHNNTR